LEIVSLHFQCEVVFAFGGVAFSEWFRNQLWPGCRETSFCESRLTAAG